MTQPPRLGQDIWIKITKFLTNGLPDMKQSTPAPEPFLREKFQFFILMKREKLHNQAVMDHPTNWKENHIIKVGYLDKILA
jgi:hypothetical protein